MADDHDAGADGSAGEDKPIPADEWEVIVRNVPIVSVDLVVRHDGGVVLGKRTNRPALGEWFVPGGTVLKHERLLDAVHRVAQEELGVTVRIERRLGVYEHFYDVADLPDVDGKHYVPVAYVVRTTEESADFRPDDQHAAIRTFHSPFEELDLHPYIRTYLEDAGLLAG